MQIACYSVCIQIETTSNHVYIADFGLGKVISTLGAGRTTIQCGTPAYQPQERIKGECCGPASDVYALGCIIVEVFGGIQVWSGMLPHTIILKVAGGSYPDISHLEDNIQRLVKLCFVPANERAGSPDILKAICRLMD